MEAGDGWNDHDHNDYADDDNDDEEPLLARVLEHREICCTLLLP